MDRLNLPAYDFRITTDKENRCHIYDPFRKKNLVLTPEEWVRQHILRYLIEERGFPASLVSAEAGIKVNRLSRRYDALIYSRSGDPLLLTECKAPGVKINQMVFDQAVAYNQTIKAPYILITNGLKHYFCKLDEDLRQYFFLKDIPHYSELNP